ncbi:MAG: hypothetical protein CSA62_11505 [Planctomycetota bacterium]|nr:MAG: hypothetical protein CSA62_11505 [Planctomycetota bacterium]
MRFRSAFLLTLCFNATIVLVDKGAGMLIYWIMRDDPGTKGRYDLITILPILLMTLANQGLASSIVYFTRRNEVDIRTAGETTGAIAWISGIVVGGLTLAVLWLWSLIDPQANLPSIGYILPILFTVPFLLTISYRNSLQLVLGRMRTYNLIHLLPSLLFLPSFLLAYFVFSEREEKFAGILARLIPAIIVAAVVVWLMREQVSFRFRVNWSFYKRALSFGWRANVNSTLTYLNHRIDYFWMYPMLTLLGGASPEQAMVMVGLYGLAVTLAELIWYVPDALRDLLFSKVAGLPKSEARLFTPVVCRNALLVCIVVGAGLFAVHDLGFSLFFGKAWAEKWAPDVTPSFAILLIGTASFTVAKIIQSDLAARGKLNACIGLGSIVLVSMTVLDLYLVPSYGPVGAALGSSIAYLLSAIASVFVYVRSVRIRFSQLLIPHREDLQHYAEVLQGLRARFGGKRDAPKES